MKTFNDLIFKSSRSAMGGIRAVEHFDNNYGVSVINSPYSYGGRDGKFELAIIDSTGLLVYDTPITNDVIGHLEPDDVTKIMEKVQKLKSRNE